MPYADRFNHYYREAMVIIANKAKNDKLPQADLAFESLFKKAAMREIITRTTYRKPYILDF